MNTEGTTRSTWSRVYGVVRIVLVVAIVGYLCWQVYSGRSALTSLRPQWDGLSLAGAFLSAIAAYQCLFVGWVILLRRTGHYSAGQVESYLRIWWISYLYRYVPGKVLLAVERARMGSAVGIPPAAGAALTVVETLLAILAGSAVSLLAVTYYTEADTPVFVGAASLAIVAVFVFPAGFRMLCGLPIRQDPISGARVCRARFARHSRLSPAVCPPLPAPGPVFFLVVAQPATIFLGDPSWSVRNICAVTRSEPDCTVCAWWSGGARRCSRGAARQGVAVRHC